MSIIGIDLGTTNSLVAQLDNVGRPQIIHNSEGSNLTPSVIFFDTNKKAVVGQSAKSNMSFEEKRTFFKFKREMGSSKTYELDGSNITPTDLSALVLQKLKQDYENAVGAADSVVITVPANFNNEAREATLAAAKAAGFETDMLLNEPTAAALFYAYQSGTKLNGKYVVYDLGGGTLDISVIQAKDEDVEVLATEGIQKLGGEDFDQKILDLVASKLKQQCGVVFNEVDYGFSRLEAEDLKKSLSNVSEKKVRLVGRDIPPTVVTITRSEFEESISGLIAQTEMLCETVLIEANVSISDIDGVFLAGGSSRIPLVKKTLEKFFHMEPIVAGNPDEAIALGAAIYAGYKANKTILNPLQAQAVAGMKFQEIAPHYFGTIYSDSRTNVSKNGIIIKKNEKIPCKKTDSFYTVHENQDSVNCRITQSPQPETDPRFVRTIWEGQLELPPNRPSGQEIAITYSYLENGTMHAEFLDVSSGKKTEVDISGQSLGAKTALNINDFIVE